jgi:hypothetical protein
MHTMRRVGLAIVVLFAVSVSAIVFVWYCIRQRNCTYRPADVKVLAQGIDDTGFTMIVQPPCDSGYYCPGVRFGRHGPSIRFERPSGHASVIHHYEYEYVRLPIGSVEKVDIPATARKDGSLAISFPFLDGKWEKGDRILLFNSDGGPCGSVECTGHK